MVILRILAFKSGGLTSKPPSKYPLGIIKPYINATHNKTKKKIGINQNYKGHGNFSYSLRMRSVTMSFSYSLRMKVIHLSHHGWRVPKMWQVFQYLYKRYRDLTNSLKHMIASKTTENSMNQDYESNTLPLCDVY